jgi:proton-translocating NADH-quinone oxidoreductase chain L
MEGPTPVSALIHAATMVTAGVYLIARCMPLFHAAPPYVLTIVACIAAFTALLSALIALTQTDLKRVLAYSTVSQIGYMFLALGSGMTDDLILTAVVAALFHLVTHAFFKALLFLSAGSVMHAMGGVIDMRRFGGLRNVLPVTHWTFLAGACALAGVPGFSGFWSKDEILGVAYAAGRAGNPYAAIHAICFLAGVITVALTAFYTFRAYFLTFWGEERIPSEAGHHAHESPAVMTVPLRVLAVGAVALGLVIQPFTHWISSFLEHNWIAAVLGPKPEHTHLGFDAATSAGCSILALAAIALAWWMYVRQPGTAERMARSARGLYELSLNKFHVDELYDFFLVRPMNALAALTRVFDQYVVDGIVDLIGNLPRLGGQVLRPIQNGLVQFYALAMMLGLTVFLSALVLRLATR